jgi:hypothetical protein
VCGKFGRESFALLSDGRMPSYPFLQVGDTTSGASC